MARNVRHRPEQEVWHPMLQSPAFRKLAMPDVEVFLTYREALLAC